MAVFTPEKKTPQPAALDLTPETITALEERKALLSAIPTPLKSPSGSSKPRRIVSHALSGTLGSLLAEFIVLPVDTVKINVQTASADDQRGFFGTAVRLVSKGGIASLYRGLGGSMIKESVHSLNYWIWHGMLFRCFAKYEDTTKTPPMLRLILNLIAKQLNWLCTVPFEVISSNNQLAKGSPGFFATARVLYDEGGVGVFYRGLPVSLMLAINPAIMNTLITSLLRILATFKQKMGCDYLDARDHSATAVGGVTAISKAVATLLTYPLIRAKVLQQTRRGSNQSLVAVLREISAAEGVAGLYRGLIAMSYKTVLWNSLMMFFKHLLGPKRSVTPPASPVLKSLTPMALMAREPFPVDLTIDKLDEILEFLKAERSGMRASRVERLEARVDSVSDDVKEMRRLLAVLASNLQGEKGAQAGGELKQVGSGPASEQESSKERHVFFKDV
eukprot:gnl/TRDRNA2_/TRDRNA2_183065_c0_seq1.p1 gnl/TRDRNA2_/TRDRNA2_183065_c0~~gnl/TRDRNA2_/TRDRNA2_183065_c0_seq1.p1  ORF type:complete len:447 (-),score=95.50 gnl/TRDRNA2_/TRDRNA2_183065_c0_seq1:88-1428(-)